MSCERTILLKEKHSARSVRFLQAVNVIDVFRVRPGNNPRAPIFQKVCMFFEGTSFNKVALPKTTKDAGYSGHLVTIRLTFLTWARYREKNIWLGQ